MLSTLSAFAVNVEIVKVRTVDIDVVIILISVYHELAYKGLYRTLGSGCKVKAL